MTYKKLTPQQAALERDLDAMSTKTILRASAVTITANTLAWIGRGIAFGIGLFLVNLLVGIF